MASFSPTIRLSSVDLPTLGRPRIAMVPATVPAVVSVAMKGPLYHASVVVSGKHAILAPRRRCVVPARDRRRRDARDDDAWRRWWHRHPRRQGAGRPRRAQDGTAAPRPAAT